MRHTPRPPTAPARRGGAVALRDRTTLTAAAALGLATALAWVGLARYGMPMGLAGYLTAWTLMMAAMMLPSIAPLVLLHRGSRTLLASGYLLVWAATGIVPFAALVWGFQPAVPIVLVLAGAYELTPLKLACLRHCRSPATFLMQHYRSGPFLLGVEHGVWCAGCCLGLMGVLVLAASMGLVWAAIIGAVVFIQKVLPFGDVSARWTGVALILAGLVLAVV